MPQLTNIEINCPPPGNLSLPQDFHAYSHPSGTVEAAFFDPYEFDMGANAWNLQITDKVSGQEALLPTLLMPEEGEDAAMIHPWPYHPFDATGRRLLLFSWSTPALIYEATSGNTLQVALPGFPLSAAGSLLIPRYVVATTDGAFLLNAEDGSFSKLDIGIVKGAPAQFYWMNGASCFFAIGQSEPEAPYAITFFEGASGEKLGQQELDPDKLLPYDKPGFEKVDRGQYSLSLEDGMWGLGEFLDRWSHIEFEPDRSVLHLRVFRPAGEVFQARGINACKAREAWLKAQVVL